MANMVDYSKFPSNLDWASFQIEYQKSFSKANGGKTLDLNDKNVMEQMKSAFAGYQSTAPSAGTTTTKTTSTGGGIVGGIVAGMKEMGVDQSNRGFDTRERIGIEGVLGTVIDTNTGKLKSFSEIIDSIKSGIGDGIVLQLKQQSQLQAKINTETGLTGELSESLRSSITEAYPAAVRLGYSFEDISSAISSMTADLGRFRLLNEETMTDVAMTSRVYFDSMEEGGRAANAFQDVSVGARDAMLTIQKAGKASLELGLNSKTTSKDLVANIGKLNEYGFNKGIDGLNQMVQKSVSLRMNMQSVFTIAEKVMDPEGALSMAAGLQAIGGAFGTFSDPIKMMYDATNNVEDLQNSLIGAAESLATYNSEQGRFEVSGANLRRARALAKELGVDYNELTKIAVNAAQRTSAAADMMANGLTFKNEEDKEFLTNLAQMKDGKMSIEIPKSLQKEFAGATSVALQDMTAEQSKKLLEFREEFQEMSTEDIAKKQVSLVENINRDVNFLAALARIRAGQTGENLIKQLGFDPAAAAKESAKMANAAASGIEVVSTAVNDGIRTLTNADAREKAAAKPTEQKSVPVAEAEKAKADAEKAKAQSQQQTQQKTQIDMNIKSNVDGDSVRRAVLNDPTVVDKFFSEFSYTSLPK